jgi:hypothetical protein
MTSLHSNAVLLKIVSKQDLVDSSPVHQAEKVDLVGRPLTLALLVRIQKILGGGEQWLMLVRRADEFPQEIREVLRLGETC